MLKRSLEPSLHAHCLKERAERIFKNAVLNLELVNAVTLESGVLFTTNFLDKGANFRSILNLCRQVRSLHIAHDRAEIAQVFKSKRIGQITRLRISNDDYITPNLHQKHTYKSPLDLQSLASSCINLENLQIEYSGIEEQDAAPLTRLEKLHTLELLYCDRLSNEMCATLSKIPALTSLHLGGWGWYNTMHFHFPNCDELFNLAQHCKKLTALLFTNCRPIDPEDYKKLMAIKPPKLNIVGMSEPKTASGV